MGTELATKLKDEVMNVFRLQPKSWLTARSIRDQMTLNPTMLQLESILGELCTKQSDGLPPQLIMQRTRRGGTQYHLA